MKDPVERYRNENRKEKKNKAFEARCRRRKRQYEGESVAENAANGRSKSRLTTMRKMLQAAAPCQTVVMNECASTI